MEFLIIAGIDISHIRLVDLTRLAEQAKPFYEWVEGQFQKVLLTTDSLDQMVRTATEPQ